MVSAGKEPYGVHMWAQEGRLCQDRTPSAPDLSLFLSIRSVQKSTTCVLLPETEINRSNLVGNQKRMSTIRKSQQ